MEADRATRVLRQFVETDLLLGVEETPFRRGVAPMEVEPTPAAATARAAPAASSAPAPAPVLGGLGDGTPQERLARLAEALAADPDLADRFRGGGPALGTGGLPARVLFVGEPRVEGHETDEAAKLLDGMVKAMKLSPEEVFRCPCIPFPPASGEHPSPADLAAGAGALRAQLELAAPEVVVAMGGGAAKALLGGNVGITRLRGAWAACGWTDPPVPVMPTLSPSFVLRSYTKDNRMMVWGDLQEVMKRLEEGERERGREGERERGKEGERERGKEGERERVSSERQRRSAQPPRPV